MLVWRPHFEISCSKITQLLKIVNKCTNVISGEYSWPNSKSKSINILGHHEKYKGGIHRKNKDIENSSKS